jgi:hypothetical protein
MLTQLRLRELLVYEPETGIFWWRRQSNATGPTLGVRERWANQRAGALTVQGYSIINVDGERFRSVRLAWLYMTGEWPTNHIDHINGDPADDRWVNLREATRSENMANAKLIRTNNTSGARGVSWNKRLEKWHARVNFERRLYHCGYFNSFEEAVESRDRKAAQLHGAFAQLNRPSQELAKC